VQEASRRRSEQALAPGSATALDITVTLEAIAEDASTSSLDSVLGKTDVDVAAASGLVAARDGEEACEAGGAVYE